MPKATYTIQTFIRLSLILTFVAFLNACATVPGTGRSQLSLVSDESILMAANSQYKTVITESTLSTDIKSTETLQKVGAKISKAAENYLIEHDMAEDIPSYNWEFNLIESPEVNAWCMPGGKIAFYTGILPYTKDETGIAVIMAHEVGHAIAKHGKERASQEVATDVGGTLLTIGLIFAGVDTSTTEAASSLFDTGVTLGILLPYSRAHETEADRIGLSLMAMAAYDPQQAIAFWERMAEASDGNEGPGFLSTHPANQERIDDINTFLPEALERYKSQKEE